MLQQWHLHNIIKWPKEWALIIHLIACSLNTLLNFNNSKMSNTLDIQSSVACWIVFVSFLHFYLSRWMQLPCKWLFNIFFHSRMASVIVHIYTGRTMRSNCFELIEWTSNMVNECDQWRWLCFFFVSMRTSLNIRNELW